MGGEPAWLGWRMLFRPAMARALQDGSLNGFWQTAEELRQPVSFLAPQMTPLFHAIAARYPCLPRIADHMGAVPEDAATGNLALRVAELAELARYSDVSVTLLLLTMFSRQACPWRVMDDHIRRHLGAFGPERCHWGTDITNYPTRTVMFRRCRSGSPMSPRSCPSCQRPPRTGSWAAAFCGSGTGADRGIGIRRDVPAP